MKPESDAVLQKRSVRSFVLRQGRMSAAKRRAYDQLLPRYGLAYQPAPIDLDALFGRAAPKVLEIGFGMGEATAALAQAAPERDFLAIEVYTAGIGALLKLIDEKGLSNVRIVQRDAVDVLRDMIAPDSLAAVHIFFPDPWPKKRHHKRRLIQPDFVNLLADRIKPGGSLHFATDWQDYAEQALQVLAQEARLQNMAQQFSPRPENRPLTRFESRGLRAGHAVCDCIFRRV